jgi:hypothetical protein
LQRSRVLLLVALALALVVPGADAYPRAAPASSLLRLVPQPAGRANFGFTFRLFDSNDPLMGDARPFDVRIRDSIDNELAGKPPTFIKVWTPWQQPDRRGKPFVPFGAALGDVAKVRAVVGERGVLHLDWNLTLSTAANDGLTVREIRRGAADAYIRSYARAVREYGRPVLMTLFNGEVNGSWWWAVSPLANPRLSTTDFVQAWRRVVDIFRAVGAANVSWAWVVNGYPGEASLQPGIDRNIEAYYPGDDYVDWVGGDVYDVGTPSWLDGPYALAVAHGKPFFVGEFGIRHEWSILTPLQQRAWLEAVFDWFESHPAVRAISYFNFCNRAGATHVRWDPARSVYSEGGQVNYVPALNDHDSRLLAGGPEVRTLFARRIASPRYVSEIATEPVEASAAVATASLLAPLVRRRSATVRWSGDLAADAYDLALSVRPGTWRTLASRFRARSYRVDGSRGGRMRVRVRAWNVDGAPGPWSPARTLVFAAP